MSPNSVQSITDAPTWGSFQFPSVRAVDTLSAAGLASTTYNSTPTTQIVAGPNNGTTYRFRVRAINAVGFSDYSKVTNPGMPTA
jgi:hypothetical protein